MKRGSGVVPGSLGWLLVVAGPLAALLVFQRVDVSEWGYSVVPSLCGVQFLARAGLADGKKTCCKDTCEKDRKKGGITACAVATGKSSECGEV